MNKLAAVLVLGFAVPAFACPNMDHDQNETPKTAEKTKEQPKAKEQPKTDAKAPADTAKAKTPAKSTDKKPGDKVSLK
jgi:hypothetical protein